MDGIFRIAEEKVAYMSVKATFRPRSGRTDKEFTTGKNLKIGIEFVGVRTIQPIEENQCAATGDSGRISSVGTHSNLQISPLLFIHTRGKLCHFMVKFCVQQVYRTR